MISIFAMFCKTKEQGLSRELSLLSWINILNVSASGLSSIFLNIFIWKMSNLSKVIEYNIYSFMSVPLVFVLAGWMSKRIGLRINLILGMAFSAIFYLGIIIFRNNLIQYIPLIGIIKSINLGFFYNAFNVLTYDFSDETNRDYFFGITGLTNSLTSMIFPLISGYIIWALPGVNGYEVIFALSFILLLAGTMVSLAVPNEFSKTDFKLIQMFKTSIVNADLRNTLLSDIISSGRLVVVSIALNILIFEIAKRELTVGNFSFWVCLAGTIANYIGGIIIKPKNRHAYLLLGTVAVAVINSVFLIDISVLMLYIFGVANAIFDAWNAITNTAIGYFVISQIPKSTEIRTEVMIVKEFAYLIGRMAALFAFMAVGGRNDLIAVLLFILGAMQVLRWVLLRNVGKMSIAGTDILRAR